MGVRRVFEVSRQVLSRPVHTYVSHRTLNAFMYKGQEAKAWTIWGYSLSRL